VLNALTPRLILERVATSITTRLSSPQIAGAWEQSTYTFEQFGSAALTEADHHTFALQLPGTTPRGDRQHPSVGTFSITELAVRWGHRIRPEAVVFDQLEAMDAEVELVAAIIATESNPRLELVLAGATRSTTRDGLVLLGDLRFSIPHNYPLA
jgi:hypothetical protein